MERQVRQGAIRKTIDDFTGGLNLFLDPTKIKDNEFTVFDNLVLYESGKFLNATKRKSIERWNTNRTVSTNPIRSMFEALFKTKGFNPRILVKTSNSLEYCESSSGAFVTIAGSLSDAKMRALMFQDNVYIANNGSGSEANSFYDGTNYLNIGLFPALQSFFAVPSTASKVNLGTGLYAYLITFVYNGIQESGIVLAQPSGDRNYVTTVGTQLLVGTLSPVYHNNATGKKIDLFSIPTGNSRVTARKIYRTKSDGNTFYYHSTISDNTTTILLNDDMDDDELGEEYNGGDGFANIIKPYTSKYHVVHQGRMWGANLKEDQYSTIDISGISASHTAAFGGVISNDVTRGAKYKYKFARDVRIIKGKELDANLLVNPSYIGNYGALSGVLNVTTDAGDTEISLTNIPIDTFSKRTAIFRNCCQFISNITGTTTLTVTVGAGKVFKNGESVTISGVTGFTSNPNGTYVISNVTATTFQITHTVSGGSYSSGGVVEGSNFYINGYTTSGVFSDGYTDSFMVENHYDVNIVNGDSYYKSSAVASDVNTPDLFPPGNIINLGQDDNEEITGIFACQRRLVVFKEFSSYEIDTTLQDISFARARKISGIGAVSDSIIQIEDQFLFLSKDNYFYQWDGYGKPIKISETIQSDIDAFTYTNIDAVYYPKLNWAVWTYSVSGTEGNILVYDLNVGKWYHFKKNGTNLNVCSPIALKYPYPDLLFGHRSAGYVMKYGSNNQDSLWSSGTTFGDVQILIKLKTKRFPDWITIKKIFAKLRSSGSGTALNLIYGNDLVVTSLIPIVPDLNIIEKAINLSGRESYYTFENAENISLTFIEIGHEYLPIHIPSL